MTYLIVSRLPYLDAKSPMHRTSHSLSVGIYNFEQLKCQADALLQERGLLQKRQECCVNELGERS